MEEMKSVNDQKPQPANKGGVNLKNMTIEEQLAYYKSIFQKSKKLNLYYDEELKKVKNKLSQYEGGIINTINK